MDPSDDDNGLNSYYHHHHHHHHQPPLHHHNPATATSASNGILQTGGGVGDRGPPHMVYNHSVPSAVSSPLETTAVVKRKRGRPRKYGTPEQAAAAKRVSSSSPAPISLPTKKKENQSVGVAGASSSSSKKSQLAALGSTGQGFTPHVIDVAAGEDVAQKIMLFMQQSKREICILSGSGSISNPSLRQPATSGGNITYEGRFDILSLSGSYIRTNLGGRTGGISVSLSSTDGQMIGGGVGGPMKAAGPVQVIVGTFLIDSKKDIAAGVKGEVSASNLSSPVGGGGMSVSGAGFQTAVDSSGRMPVRSSGDNQIMGGNQFMMQPRGITMTPSRSSEWGSGTNIRSNSNYDLAGRTGPGSHLSPENGNYE